jgi:hypothetical protein
MLVKRVVRLRRPRLRRGHALATVLVFVTVLSSWYALVSGRFTNSLRVQKLNVLKQTHDLGSMQALAQTLELLEIGLPSITPLTGAMSVINDDGTVKYAVTIVYEKSNRYKVTVAPLSAAESLPELPLMLTGTKHPK